MQGGRAVGLRVELHLGCDRRVQQPLGEAVVEPGERCRAVDQDSACEKLGVVRRKVAAQLHKVLGAQGRAWIGMMRCGVWVGRGCTLIFRSEFITVVMSMMTVTWSTERPSSEA